MAKLATDVSAEASRAAKSLSPQRLLCEKGALQQHLVPSCHLCTESPVRDLAAFANLGESARAGS